MMQFDRITLGRQAKEVGFVRDTFEKVCRLADVLSFMESDALLSASLGLIDETQESLFKKCIIFYSAIGSEKVPEHFDFSKVGKISAQKIKTDLLPVLRKTEHFDLTKAQKEVDAFLKRILLPEGDLSFWEAFAKGKYKPELLFDNIEILSRIEKHPMALWKCSKMIL